MGRKFWVSVGIVVLSVSFYIFLHRHRGREVDESHTVFIKKMDGRQQLFRNGQPFYIQGASGKSYLKELSEAGGNTLRVYDTINLKYILSEAEKYDLAIVVDIPLPAYSLLYDYYSDLDNVKDAKEKIRKLVRTYKNHPSLLIWNLGNELNYPLTFKSTKFVEVFNEMVEIIHSEDPNHPVSTTISGTSRSQTLGIHLNSPKLDLIGFNAFGNLPKLQSMMSMVGFITNAKPYYIMEWGSHGPWEAPINLWEAKIEPNSTEKGQVYKDVYKTEIKTNETCLGNLAFYWGNKQEGTPTWFNVFDSEGRKAEAYYALKSLWTGENNSQKEIPKIEQMLLLSSDSKDQIVDSKDILDARIVLQTSKALTYKYNWNIYKEAWGTQKWMIKDNLIKISDSITTELSNQIKFHAPSEQGAYRIFVHVNDSQGNFATANMPFYVMSRR